MEWTREASLDSLPGGGDYDSVANSLEVLVTDDDDPGLDVSESAITMKEDAIATFTVKLSTAPSETVSVDIDGHVGTDLSLDTSSLSFTQTNWDTAQTITLSTVGDADLTDDTVTLTLRADGGEYSGVSDTVTVTIDDDDPGVRVSFGSGTYGVVEGETVTVTVGLSVDPERTVVVPITAADQGGAGSGDYSGVPASVTFNSGETSKTFTFMATEDTVDDDDESVKLTFGQLPVGVSAGTTAESVVSIDDDDRPTTFEMSFGSATYTVAEGGTVTVTVSLTSDAETAVTVPLTATPEAGATSGDYSGVPSSVAFGAGDDEQTFTFMATQDSDDDDGESVKLTFGMLPTGVSAGSPSESTVSITDDDDPGVRVSFGSGTYGVVEGETVTVTVGLSADPERTVVVPITAADQGGAGSGDYSGVPASVTFNSGDTSKTFTFMATEDTVDDDDESVKLTFGQLPAGVSAGSPSESVVSIDDDDRPTTFEVSFGSAAYTVAEGGTVTVTVSLTSDAETAVTVPLTATPEGGATSGDYSGVPSSVTFGAGDDEQTFTFMATQDSDDDDGESVKLTFGMLPTGVSAGSPSESTVSITDDDDPGVRVSFGSATYGVVEGETVTVTVGLSADPERTVVVPITAAGQGGATSGDYSGVPASVTFNSGDTSKTFTFMATQDTVDDDDESVKLTFGQLPAGVSAGTTAESVVSIDDDDRPTTFQVSFGSATYTVAEGGTVTVTVSLTSDAETAVTVPLTATPEGGATSGDYSGVPSSVAFGAGDDEQTFTFMATQDSDDDDGESVKLTFGMLPTGVSAGSPSESTVTITDDDDPGVRVSFGSATYAVAEGETVTVTVGLSADPERTVVVPITAAGQGGAGSGDYSGVPASVTFASGETSKTFTFMATQDTVDDDDESVKLTFGQLPAGVSAESPSESVVSITDDDDPAVTVSFGSATYAVAEGETVTVTVELSADPERTVVVPLTATLEGGAGSGDYSGVPASVTFESGETSKTFTFMATQDTDDDDDESVNLTFGQLPAGVSAGTTAESVVTIRQDSGRFLLDCSQALWCANLHFDDYTALDWGWNLLQYNASFSPPASLSDPTFDFRGVEYTIRAAYVVPGIYPEIDNAWNRVQRDQGEFQIAISHGRTWQAVPEAHYQDWELHIGGGVLPFSEATRQGERSFQWYGLEFQELFVDWTPSTVNKIGIREISPTLHVPAVPSAPAYVGVVTQGSDWLHISWSPPLSRLRNQSVTGYTVQWKQASDSWSDSAAVSSKPGRARTNLHGGEWPDGRRALHGARHCDQR